MRPETLLRWIGATVVGGHLLFLCWLGWVSSWSPPMAAKAPPRLVVQTVSVKDPPLLLARADEPPPPPPPPVPPQPSETSEFPVGHQPEQEAPEEVQPLPVVPPPPKPKPIEIRHPIQKKPKLKTPVPQIDDKKKKPPKSSMVSKNEVPKQNEALKKLLASAEESIAKIDKNADKKKAASSKVGMIAPGKIEALQIDAIAVSGEVLTGTEATYRDELAMRLRRLLRLPEHGDVKLKLTLDRSGKVSLVAITSAQSALNKTYVESMLPTLKFNDFGKNFSGQNQYTFIINLTNE